MIEIPDEGMVKVKVGGGEVDLDAYKVWNLIVEARDAAADAGEPATRYQQRIVDILEAEGLPRLSHYQADRFVVALRAAVDELGKADGTEATPASPGPSVPASSPSPAA